MPIHRINYIEDALKLVERYNVRAWLGDHATNVESFAHYLCGRVRVVQTENLISYVDDFIAERPSGDQDAADFDDAALENAQDVSQGYLCYEECAEALRQLIRRERTTQLGSRIWATVAGLAVTRICDDHLSGMPSDVAAGVLRVLEEISSLRLDDDWDYFPGTTPMLDAFLKVDIEHLDETLADHSKWKDDDELNMPLEVQALGKLAKNQDVIAELTAKLAIASASQRESSVL